MVASDTGPLHLAAALGTPSVGIFGTTSQDVCGPYGPACLSLQMAFDRSPDRKRRGADDWAVKEVTVDMACEACDQLLGRLTGESVTRPSIKPQSAPSIGWGDGSLTESHSPLDCLAPAV